MIRIILIILKIIGITLASLLGLILVLGFLVLFVPICYKVDAVKSASTAAHAKVSWLFRIIYVNVSYENDKLNYVVRLFGYPLFATNKEKRKKKPKHKKDARKKVYKNSDEEKLDDPSLEGQISITSIENESSSMDEMEEAVEDKVNETIDDVEESINEAEETVEKEAGKIKKIFTWLKSIPEKIRNFKKTFRKLKKKIKQFWKQSGHIKDFLLDEDNKESFKGIFGYLIEGLKVLQPKKYQCKVEFGTGDPCTTGELLGIISLVHLRFFDQAQVIPHFEEKIFEAELYAKGRIHGYRILYLIIKLIRDKRIKNIYKNINGLKEEL